MGTSRSTIIRASRTIIPSRFSTKSTLTHSTLFPLSSLNPRLARVDHHHYSHFQSQRRYASGPLSQSPPPPSPPPPRLPLPMLPNMPREDYASPAIYALSYLGRILRLVALGIISLGTIGLMGFEGVHMYVEKMCLPPSCEKNLNEDSDSFGWAEENIPWTGGIKGGTDPRLGWSGRHALRGAWIVWNWGSGDIGGFISTSRAQAGGSFHPDMGKRGMIGKPSISNAEGGANRVHRGFEMADEYVNVAIRHAKRKGLIFPGNLSSGREAGPLGSSMSIDRVGNTTPDPTAVDLLLLKANIQERINTGESLSRAKDIYEQVLASNLSSSSSSNPSLTSSSSSSSSSRSSTSFSPAQTVRLAHKIGTLSLRLGEESEAMEWWSWGLSQAGLTLPIRSKSGHENPISLSSASSSSSSSSSASSSWRWWPSSWSSSKSNQSSISNPITIPAAFTPVSKDLSLSPSILRAVISILASSSAHLAQSGNLDDASAVQTYALSLFPTDTYQTNDSSPSSPSSPSSASISSLSSWPSPIRIPQPTPTTAASTLHNLWIQHRLALITLYQAGIEHVKSSSSSTTSSSSPTLALDLTTNSYERAESVVSALTPHLPIAFGKNRTSPFFEPAKNLQRDALLLAAESSFTRGVLLEGNSSSPTTTVTKGTPKQKRKGENINVILDKEPERDHDLLGRLEAAGECYERAMNLAAAESTAVGGLVTGLTRVTSGRSLGGLGSKGKDEGEGDDSVLRSEEWNKYWRAYARVREKLVVAKQ